MSEWWIFVKIRNCFFRYSKHTQKKCQNIVFIYFQKFNVAIILEWPKCFFYSLLGHIGWVIKMQWRFLRFWPVRFEFLTYTHNSPFNICDNVFHHLKMYPCVFGGNMSCLLLGEKMTYSLQKNIFYEMYYGCIHFWYIALTEKLWDLFLTLAYLCNEVNSVLLMVCRSVFYFHLFVILKCKTYFS